MRIHETGIAGLLLFEPTPQRDGRGWFSRTFDAGVAREAGVNPEAFVQDSQSRTVQGGLRGLHGRVGEGEAKLVRCANGAIFDVVVDARPDSPTLGHWESFRLDDENLLSLYIPRGCLHGFQALTGVSDTCYRIDAEYDPHEGVTVRWDDPDLAIPWPLDVSTMSDSDREAPAWQDIEPVLQQEMVSVSSSPPDANARS